MGKITTSIHLTDGVSPALRKMQGALSTTIGSFNTLQSEMGSAVNTKSLTGFSNKLNEVNSTLLRIAESSDRTAQMIGNALGKQNNLNTAFDRGEQEVGGIDKKLDEIVRCLGTLTMSAQRLISTTSQIAHTTGKVESKLKYANNSHFKLNQTAQRMVSILSQEATGANRVAQGVGRAGTAQQKFNNNVRTGTGLMGGLVGKVTALVGAYAGVQGAKSIIGTADQLTMTNARLNLMNDGMQTTAQLEDKIYQMAMRSRGGFMETADAVAKLGQRAGNIFKSNDETIAFTETLNKMFVIAGASQAEMSSATLQLTQALGSGVLRGEEFNAVFEAAPNVMQAVADYINQPIGKLKELASDGKISAEIVKNALFAATDKVNKQFESMPYTWAQVWQTIKNYTIKATRPILQAISDITKSERFIRFANGLGNAITFAAGLFKNLWTVAAPILGGIFDLVAGVADCFINNWSWIAPLVAGVAAAFLVMKTPLMMVAIWTGICTAATKLWTAAQAVFNAVMAMNPVGLVILAIIALVALFYAAIAAVNKWCGTSLSATGIICGAFMVLVSYIYNQIAFLWNHIAAFVEFFVNVWTTPMYSVKKLFVNLATNVIDCLISMTKGCDKFATAFANAILWAVNKAIQGWNKFVDMLPEFIRNKLGLGKGVEIEARTSFTSDLESAKAGLQGILGEEPKGYWKAPKMEFKDLGEAAMKGYNWGNEKGTQLENFMSGRNFTELSGDELNKLREQYGKVDKYGNPIGGTGQNDIGKALSGGLGSGSNPALDSIAKNTGQTAKNTGQTADNTADLSYMRDLAEREAINRFTLTDMTMNMTNNNSINSQFDMDSVVDYIQRKVYEGVSTSAEGMHF